MTSGADPFELSCFHFSPEGEEVVCRFASPLDHDIHPAGDFEQELRSEFQPGGRLAGRRPVISLEGVPAISSRQLGALLSLHRGASGEGGDRVEVRGAGPNIRRLFEQAQMSSFFNF